jgi:hypothetical protein
MELEHRVAVRDTEAVSTLQLEEHEHEKLWVCHRNAQVEVIELF